MSGHLPPHTSLSGCTQTRTVQKLRQQRQSIIFQFLWLYPAEWDRITSPVRELPFLPEAEAYRWLSSETKLLPLSVSLSLWGIVSSWLLACGIGFHYTLPPIFPLSLRSTWVRRSRGLHYAGKSFLAAFAFHFVALPPLLPPLSLSFA